MPRKPLNRKLSDTEQKKRIEGVINMRSMHYTYEQIACAYSISTHTVNKILKDAGKTNPVKKVTHD